MNNRELSKIKYLYKMHGSINSEVHVERYPVVYINSMYCYVKENGSDELTRIRTESIRKSFSTDDNFSIGKYYNSFTYWYLKLDYKMINHDDLNNLIYKKKAEEELMIARQRVDTHRRNYDEAIETLNRLEKKYSK